MRLIHSFLALPVSEKKLFIEGVAMLYYAKAFISIFPFKTCIKKLKSGNNAFQVADLETVKAIRSAISRANKVAFWENMCLVSALAARIMLNKRDIQSVIHLGLKFEHKRKIHAHAWIMVDDIIITPKGDMNFKEIYSF